MNGNFYNNNVVDNKKYIQNVIKMNCGKKIKAFITDLSSNNDKELDGIIEDINEDSIIISNPNNGCWYLIFLMYLKYIVFEEDINLNN